RDWSSDVCSSDLRPSASSPFWVAYPSHSTGPFSTGCPFLTIGFKLMQALWFVFLNLIRRYVFTSSSNDTNRSSSERSNRILISLASTYSTTTYAAALINERETRATRPSKPVPTIGASGRNKGTA